MMKIWFKVVVLCSFLVTGVIADEVSYKKTFDKMLEVSQGDAILNDLQNGKAFNQIMEQVYRSASDTLSEKHKKELNKTMQNIIGEMAKELREHILAMYQKFFSESDLQEMIKFYQTPVGTKMATHMMAINQEVQNTMIHIMPKYLGLMQQEIQKVSSNKK